MFFACQSRSTSVVKSMAGKRGNIMAAKPAPSVPETPLPPKQLKPEALDTLAAEYLGLQKEIEDEVTALTLKLKPKAERLEELRPKFLAQCVAHGSPYEKKSKLLSGLEYEVMTTESSSSSLDQPAIGRFREGCEKMERLSVFEEIFEKVSEYRKRPAADEVVRRTTGEKLTPTLALLYLKCTIVKNSPARLAAVRPRQKDCETAK